MRANYQMKRLFVQAPLGNDLVITPTQKQMHYLLHVLRLGEGAEVLVFNGEDGEWRASLEQTTKRATNLKCLEQTRPQSVTPTLELIFAPLKVGRMDYIVQKAVEMGVGHITPMQTEFTQNNRIAIDKLEAYAEEAAEQCGILSLPHVQPLEKLTAAAMEARSDRTIIFCDEDHAHNGPLAALSAMENTKPISVLIGPEGGFSDKERDMLRSFVHIVPLPLGPRILRADTAAVAALALVQATKGDWLDPI